MERLLASRLRRLPRAGTLVLAAAEMACLFWLSSADRELPGVGGWFGDWIGNLAHLPAYGLLGGLWFHALGRFEPGIERTLPGDALPVLLTTAYGLFDEWHQSFVPGRSGNVLDLGVDLLAAWLAVAAAGRVADGRPIAGAWTVGLLLAAVAGTGIATFVGG